MDEIASLTEPDSVYWCDGSAEEYDRLAQVLIDAGTFERLNEAKRPNSYLALSDPADVARFEDRTFICSEKEEDAGPTNNWATRRRCERSLTASSGLHGGPHDVRRPLLDGPVGSDISEIGVELTDSAYVATNMRIMTRMGKPASMCSDDGDFVPACTRSGCR